MPVLISAHAAAQAPSAPPLVREGDTVRVSEHVYVIPDRLVPMVPNVGIVVGARAMLVVDPSMGARSGETVLGEVARLTRNAEIYIVNTHFHPEHATGEAGFPPGAKVLRAAAQQLEHRGNGDALGAELRRSLAARSSKPCRGSARSAPAGVFEREKTLDLGGVSVRLVRLGPGHTRGDTVFFVEQDRDVQGP